MCYISPRFVLFDIVLFANTLRMMVHYGIFVWHIVGYLSGTWDLSDGSIVLGGTHTHSFGDTPNFSTLTLRHGTYIYFSSPKPMTCSSYEISAMEANYLQEVMAPSEIVLTSFPQYSRLGAKTQQTRDVITPSLLCRNDVATSFWRYNDDICTLCVRWEELKAAANNFCSFERNRKYFKSYFHWR